MAKSPLPLLGLLLAAAPAQGADLDTRAALEHLMGRSKADVVRTLGPRGDTVNTVDGQRLFYEKIDAGRIGARAGQGARDDSGGTGLSSRDYSFRCRTEVVIRDGKVAAFNRSGNDCH